MSFSPSWEGRCLDARDDGAAIELYLSAMHFRDAAESRGLVVCLPEMADVPPLSEERSEERYLEGLFNPLLFLQGVTPVPCSIPTASARCACGDHRAEFGWQDAPFAVARALAVAR